jgi:hypothetical protein
VMRGALRLSEVPPSLSSSDAIAARVIMIMSKGEIYN